MLFLPLWGFLPRPRLIRFRLEKDAKEAKKAKKAKKAVFFNRKRQKNQTWKAKKGKKPEAGRLRQRWPGLARSARAQVGLGLSPGGPRAEPVWAPTTLGPAESPSLCFFAFFASQLCIFCLFIQQGPGWLGPTREIYMYRRQGPIYKQFVGKVSLSRSVFAEAKTDLKKTSVSLTAIP